MKENISLAQRNRTHLMSTAAVLLRRSRSLKIVRTAVVGTAYVESKIQLTLELMRDSTLILFWRRNVSLN